MVDRTQTTINNSLSFIFPTSLYYLMFTTKLIYKCMNILEKYLNNLIPNEKHELIIT